ncbi:MAG: hypothetical protein ABWY39_04200, partial [Mycobacterium sp.]
MNAVLAGVAAELGEDTPLGAALLAFQGGGPLGVVLTGLGTALAPPDEPAAAGDVMALVAQSGDSTSITSVGGLFGQNAARSFVDVFAPSQAGAGTNGAGTNG